MKILTSNNAYTNLGQDIYTLKGRDTERFSNSSKIAFKAYNNTSRRIPSEVYRQFALSLGLSKKKLSGIGDGRIFSREYYENGKQSGLSCYMNYSWKPDSTLPTCEKLIEFLQLKSDDKVLDYGCAKGFMVKGLRSFGIDAKGFDISNYAISSAPEDVKQHLSNDIVFQVPFDWIISKDVLEHVDKKDLGLVLNQIKISSQKSFIIVPLAENGKYIVPENESDITHKIREPIEWWLDQFDLAKLKVTDLRYELPPIKAHQTKPYPNGTAFISLKS